LFVWDTTHRKPACAYQATGNVASAPSCTFTPGGAWIKMAMTYDGFGNATSEAVTASGGVSNARLTTMSYSTGNDAGYFPISVTNPLNQNARMEHEQREGNVTKLVDVKGQAVRMQYDAFGREIERYFPVNENNNNPVPGAGGPHYAPRSSTRYAWAGGSGCPGGSCGDINGQVYTIKNLTDGSPVVSETFDRMNRVVQRTTNGFNGIITETMAHSARGEVKEVSEPRLMSEPAVLTRFTYDPLGRPATKQQPQPLSGERQTTYQYAGLETTVWVMSDGGTPGVMSCNPDGSSGLVNQLCVKRVFGSGGDLLRTTDAHGAVTRFWANSQGNVALIQDAAGNLTGANYNALGQRTQLWDPDMGIWTFAYNGLGELTSQTDAKGQSFSFIYDKLGRLTTRQVGTGSQQISDTWVYDDLEDGRSANGLLARTQRTVGGQLTYDRIFLYDTLLKPAGHDTALDADLIAGGSLQTFTLTQKLDSYFGRVISVTDPEFRGRGEYRYNRDGYLQNVKAHLRNSDNTIRSQLVKTVTALSARGQVVNVSFGNGLTDSRTYYPQTGQVKTLQVGNALQGAGAVLDLGYGYDKYLNLTSQINAKIGFEELYSYDRLHRLTSRSGPQEISTTTPIDPSPSSAGTESDGTTAPIGPSPKPVVTAGGAGYAYDPLGNLTNKTDYATGYTYGQLFTAPQVVGCNNDGRGFRTTVAPGPHAVTELSVNAQGVASNPLGGGTTSGTPTLHQLAYDKNGNLLCFGDGSLNLWYDPYNLPAKITRFNQIQEFRYGPDLQRYLQVAAGVTTVYLERSYEKELASGKVRFQIAEDVLLRMATGQNPVIDYQHRDRLGSIVAVTDEFQAIERGTERGFGPFGKPRDANWNDQNILPGSDITPRGFTDHEHLNGSRLIHMNGRAYDYNLGRFLSVDPIIQFPENSQSLNPYSYIQNNPLSGVDPTGYATCSTDDPSGCAQAAGELGAGESVSVRGTMTGSRIAREVGTIKADGGGTFTVSLASNGGSSAVTGGATQIGKSSEGGNEVNKAPDQIGASDNRENMPMGEMMGCMGPLSCALARLGNGLAGAGAGALSGGTSGGLVGAGVGALAGGGVGAGPGAVVGAGAGAIGGGIVGFVEGVTADPNTPVVTVVNNAIVDGALAGAASGAGVAVNAARTASVAVTSGASALSKIRVRPDIVLKGGRSGQNVKNLVGPANTAVRGGGERVFITNEKGLVILDITKSRVKPVIPGQGFVRGGERPPTAEELDILSRVIGGTQ